MAGLAVSWLNTPKYPAEAVLGVTINYAVTEPLELVVEDRALNKVAAIIMADTTLAEVLNRIPNEAKNERNWRQPADLRAHLRLDQRRAEWGLVAVDGDPVTAAEVAQIWAEVTIEELDEAMSHAWRAQALAGGRYDVACAPVQNVAPPVWECQTSPLALDAAVLDGQIQTETALSRGILTAISYELLREAVPADSPISLPGGLQVLSGAVAGLLIGGFVLILMSVSTPSSYAIRD